MPTSQHPDLDDVERTNVLSTYRSLYETAVKALTAVVQMVAPEVAEKWLAKNAINRPLGLATVDRYALYITKGLWRVNGEPIILAADETLLDGQHRLRAVVKANVAVPMLVVLGVEKDAFRTLNQGKIRSAADTLFTIGEGKKSRILASALHWLYRYETNSIQSRNLKLANAELADLLADFPDLRLSAEWVMSRYQKGMHPPGPFTFLHYVCTSRHPQRVDFFEQVLTGANLAPSSPAHVLHGRLQRMAKENKGRSNALTVEMAALVIKAWNATVEGRTLHLLKWSSENEAFPDVL